MTLSIVRKIKGTDTVAYYDPDFRKVIEDHLIFLRDSTSTKVQTIGSDIAWKYEYGFYWLLEAYNVPSQLWWICLRMMDFKDQYEVNADLTHFLIPDMSMIERIRSTHQTTVTVNV